MGGEKSLLASCSWCPWLQPCSSGWTRSSGGSRCTSSLARWAGVLLGSAQYREWELGLGWLGSSCTGLCFLKKRFSHATAIRQPAWPPTELPLPCWSAVGGGGVRRQLFQAHAVHDRGGTAQRHGAHWGAGKPPSRLLIGGHHPLVWWLRCHARAFGSLRLRTRCIIARLAVLLRCTTGAPGGAGAGAQAGGAARV